MPFQAKPTSSSTTSPATGAYTDAFTFQSPIKSAEQRGWVPPAVGKGKPKVWRKEMGWGVGQGPRLLQHHDAAG